MASGAYHGGRKPHRAAIAHGWRTLVAFAAVGLALALPACGGAGAMGTEPPAAAGSGARPPDFELDSLDGQSVRLGDYVGKDVVLLDFWATYCPCCLTLLPHLEQLYRRYRHKQFIVLGIAIDGPDSQAEVRTEAARLGVTFPILMDTETRVVSLYNPKTSAPYAVLIGRHGRIIMKQEGYTPGDNAGLDQRVRAALAAR